MQLFWFSGERTRGHFFGEQIESFLNIDMYRRPATTYTGRVVMDYGRPGDGYYTQRFPSLFHYHLLMNICAAFVHSFCCLCSYDIVAE